MAPLKNPKQTKASKKTNRIQSHSSTVSEDNDFSTQTEQSKQAIHRNNTQDTSSPLSVAITCGQTGILWQEESEMILTAIQKKIISEANSTDPQTTRPTFNSEPLFEEGVLKLWCGNDDTLSWLKTTVSNLCIPRLSPVVKSQLEIKKRVRCEFQIPDEQRVFKESADIGRVVCYQNPWVDVQKWELIEVTQSDSFATTVRVGVPEDQIPTLLKAERRLSIGLTRVYP